MHEHLARGLTADWLNAWLAAVGVTVLLPEARLRWTEEPLPKAVFETPNSADLAESIADVLPTLEQLDYLVINGLRRKVTRGEYQQRAHWAREKHDWSLSSSVTDLGRGEDGGTLQHAPLDPPAPRGVTLHERLIACRREIDDDPVKAIGLTLGGRAKRAGINGLGFDYRRIGEGGGVDPALECLAFFALSLLPLRGDGRSARQRGWNTAPSKRGSFCWPAWATALDCWAIDALLDEVHLAHAGVEQHLRSTRTLRRRSITAVFGSVPYQARGSADVTRGYASERIL